MTRTSMRRFCAAGLVLLISLWFGAFSATTQECPELVGRVPYGPARVVAVQGDYVYYNNGSMLMIADASSPASPVVVGEIQMPSLIRGIEAEGGLVHLACGIQGYWIVDASTPSAPAVIGSYSTGYAQYGDQAHGIAANGDLVFVAGGISGLTILDVSEPSVPVLVSRANVVSSYAVDLNGSFAYLIGDQGLRIVDVSDPGDPVVIGSAPGQGFDIVVAGDYAYVTSNDGLRVFNVLAPASPFQASLVGPPGVEIAKEGDSLFVTAGFRFYVLDLVDPAVPSVVGEAEVRAFGVAVQGADAFLASHDEGLIVFDVGDPTAPSEIASLDSTGSTLSVASSGSLMFANGGWGEIRVFDVANPSAPVGITTAEVYGTMWDFEVTDDVLYAATSYSLRWIDISDPAAPVEIDSVGNGARSLEVVGPLLHVGSWADAYEAFDISSPESPLFLGRATLSDSALDLAVTGGHAFVVVSGNNGLEIIDVADPTQPVVIGGYGRGEIYYRVAASENLVFVAAGSDLRILDVTNPGSPVELASYDPGEGAGSVDVFGDLAYVGCWDPSLVSGCDIPVTVLDVSDPSSPVPVGGLTTMVAPGAPEQTKVVGDFVYLAQSYGGISILRGCHALLVDGFESGDTSAWSGGATS